MSTEAFQWIVIIELLLIIILLALPLGRGRVVR
jgi:hypothetical protein